MWHSEENPRDRHVVSLSSCLGEESGEKGRVVGVKLAWRPVTEQQAGSNMAGREALGKEFQEKKKSTLRVWPVSKETQKREKRKVAPLGGQTQ